MKRIKKWLGGLAGGCMAFIMSIGLTACEGALQNTPETDPEHEHAYTAVVIAPTCTEQGFTTHTCECGDSYVDTYVDKLGHNFVDNVCQACLLETSKGLEFTLNSDGESYAVTGIGFCTDTEIVISPTYENLPVTSIGERAFRDCSSLTSIYIPNSVISIGRYAFRDCNSLISIDIPDSVTSIDNGAFYHCSSLTEIVIPDSVTSIGDDAFEACSSLTEIVIPDSVTSIGYDTFYYCDGLTKIVIPDSVTSIGGHALGYCSSLTEIVIPNSVTSIESYAFEYCSSLTEVIIGDGVTSIGRSAFAYCSSLTEIVLPDSVTSIGDWAFAYCRSLTIYCEITEKPSGWDSSWNYSNRPVVWGYSAE